MEEMSELMISLRKERGKDMIFKDEERSSTYAAVFNLLWLETRLWLPSNKDESIGVRPVRTTISTPT